MPIRSQFSTDADFLSAMRDWFAGQAMASLILVPATAAIARQDGNLPTKTLALAAYEAADAMLAAREK